MKAFLVKEIIKIRLGESYLDPKLFKNKVDGIYIVDDGIAYMLIEVVNGLGGMTIPIPRDSIIKDHTPEETLIEHKLEARLAKSLDGLRSEVAQVLDNSSDMTQFNLITSKLNEVITAVQNGGSSNVDLSDLTKLIAVAQKPELLDKKVK